MRPVLPLVALLVLISACRTDTKSDTAGIGTDCTWYTDADGDGWGDPGAPATGSCDDAGAGFVDNDGDCDDGDAAVHPDADELCDGLDNDCDGLVDDADDSLVGGGAWYADLDGDGYGDDANASVACEPAEGWVQQAGDCDDANAEVFPGAPERCDGLDNDCDGAVDEDLAELWYEDGDGDGFGDQDAILESCDPGPGWVADDSDCDDRDGLVFPGAPELCNGYDDDCDGEVDEELGSVWFEDDDGDGFGDPDASTIACDPGPGWVADDGDCDDANSDINPDADERCNGYDDDCDALVDDADPDVIGAAAWYLDVDGDGYGADSGAASACEQPSGYVAYGGDCDDSDAAYNPGAVESDCTDPADYNCDGSTGYSDLDGDGWAACEDCDDGDAAIRPDGSELCNGVDDDCDGDIDEDSAADAATWYQDGDGDGYGDAASTVVACDEPSGYSADATDCDDTDAAVSPAGAERCNGVDDDCDGDVDEGVQDTFHDDADGDGWGDAAVTTTACDLPSGYADNDGDCDDSDAAVSPDGVEQCNGYDDDCDGAVDEASSSDAATWYADADSDGYGSASYTAAACAQPAGYVGDATDCDDSDAGVNPAATEACNGYDDDCDGDVDEGVEVSWYLDYDGDGYGSDGTATSGCSAPSSLYVSTGGDCDDGDSSAHPTATPGCDGGDYDCDGLVDNDADGDGYADAACGGDDCDDSDAATLPEVGGGCALGVTCLDILNQGRSVGDGDYTIDPDGWGAGLDPFEVWCDMGTDGGGWTAIDYAADLPFQQQFTGGDAYRYLTDDFAFVLDDDQIAAIQALSTDGWQYYEGWCEHVIHYYYTAGATYGYAFGFMFFDGTETPYGTSSYSPYSITVTQDGCKGNGGEGGDPADATIFLIESPLVPVLNVQCRDCGDTFPEYFGSPLTDNSAWLR